MAKGERTLTRYTMFFPESIRKKDITSDHPAVTNWDDGWPLQVWWIYFPRLNKEPVYCWHTILTSFPEHGDDTLYLNCSIWLRSRSKVRLHVCGGCIEIEVCVPMQEAETQREANHKRRKINVTQEIFGTSETNFGGIIWMKQTPACLSHLVHIFISKPFVFFPPFISSLVSSSGLLS